MVDSKSASGAPTLAFRSVYIAFDSHPSYKGASTHIHHMTTTLAECYGPTLLLTLKGEGEEIRTPTIYQSCFESLEPNLLKRAQAFSEWANEQLAQQYYLEIGHFRDVWGGMAILNHPHILPLYEVNSFPSIEMPMRFSQLTPAILKKLEALENHCLFQAKQVITPSYTIQNAIVRRGIKSDKIEVIPNGATLVQKVNSPPLAEKYLVYIGALQPWQGVDVLFRAMKYLRDKDDLRLVVCCSHTEHKSKPYKKFAEKLGITDQVIWKYQLSKKELQKIIQHALLSVAPLTECSRNIEQGCSPLKIFESMACGVPVVASDLPVIREIISHNINGVLVRPGRPAEIARAVRLLLDYPEQRQNLGEKARQSIAESYTWSSIEQNLKACYLTLPAKQFSEFNKAYQYG
jgi:glycosyltransferase involved in cell wall biosynthesis